MKAPHTCYAHRERSSPAPACGICARIGVEVDIITKAVDALLAAGYALQVDDGESRRPDVPTVLSMDILAELRETDDDHVLAWARGADRAGRPNGWVRFVYGNDGYDVISDYTTNLESVLAPVNAYAETLA